MSVGANEEHGLRRTNEDKRRAVLTLLGDAEWSSWSDREIARQCAVGYTLVAKLRPDVTARAGSGRTFTTKHGTTAVMDTTAIGKTPPVRAFDEHQAREHVEAAKVIPAVQRADKGLRQGRPRAALFHLLGFRRDPSMILVPHLGQHRDTAPVVFAASRLPARLDEHGVLRVLPRRGIVQDL